ncbi:MAG: SDR family oxidoreductase [Rhodobacterales bacterium]|nr:SDR family oxidoreductase [Rhodobacterales bacterium]
MTGGASGIGAASARILRDHGAEVAVLDRAVVSNGDGICVDITDSAAVERAVEAAAAKLGGIDGLVNCAGILKGGRVETMSPDNWRQVIDVNLNGTFFVTRAVIPHLREAGQGTIVTIASASGLLPSDSAAAAYGASKAGVDMFMKYLAKEVAPGIRVNSICPGLVETPMMARVTASLSPEEIAGGLRPYALKRAAAPQEIAEAVLWLTSDKSGYVTGISLPIDGGRTFH